jgi:hypothetical protein
MPVNVALVARYFDTRPAAAAPTYFTLGAQPLTAGAIGQDSSDQSVLLFDQMSGIAAHRSALSRVDASNTITHRAISPIDMVASLPTLEQPYALAVRLALQHRRELLTRRSQQLSAPWYPGPVVSPRMVAALEREVADYTQTHAFLNSTAAWPGMLFLRDGRLNAQPYPGAAAYDQLYRLMAARRVRCVGVAKSSPLLEFLRPQARAIRRRVADRPFAMPVLPHHLHLAYPKLLRGEVPRTLRHGTHHLAYGGVGAVRFALSPIADELLLVEFNLYDLHAFRPLIAAATTLDAWHRRTYREDHRPVSTLDLLPFVGDRDWETLLIPTLEQIVGTCYTETERGLYPRPLADVHNRVKLRRLEVEPLRRQLVVALAGHGVSPGRVPEEPEDPHKTDPDIVNWTQR